MKGFSLSPHTLTLFLECPRCFWFHVKKGEGFRRPEGPSSSLPRGMDNLIKKYFDYYRKKRELPPEISHLKASLVSEEVIKKWRYWRTGLIFKDEDGSSLYGALDECLIEAEAYVPLDYKTRGFSLKEDSTSFYVFQMSCYNFLLEKNGYQIKNYAYLVFYIPEEFHKKGVVQFNIEVKKIKTLSMQKVYEIFKGAVACLNLSAPPSSGKDCRFCEWANRISSWQATQLKLF